MSGAVGERFELAGWRLVVPAGAGALWSGTQKEVVENALAALDGKRGIPFRRSRHATTWKVSMTGATGAPTDVFVKQLDAPHGFLARAKATSRPRRSDHVLRISEALRRANFGVPEVLLIGENLENRRELIVTSRARGSMLTRWMNPAHRTRLALRRSILRELGAETARLHLRGFIHGDLTPFNIFATDDHPVAITFMDHEGTVKTARASVNLVRNRLRNLVQLGHFDIPGVSRTDKLRVFDSYAATTGLPQRERRRLLLRLMKMIARRSVRDGVSKRGMSQTAIIVEEGPARKRCLS